MTTRALLLVMSRRWYVPLAVFCAAVALFHVLAERGGIYTTTSVISCILAPKSSLEPYNGSNNKDVIAFAGEIAQQLNNGQPPRGFALSDAPLYGAGLRQGVLIELPNDGDQWSTSFQTAQIDIEIVGSEAWVKHTQSRLVSQALSIGQQLQNSYQVSTKERIAVSVVPATRRIDAVPVSKKSELMAGAALTFAAFLVSTWGAAAVDRTLHRRRASSLSRGARGPGLTIRSQTT